MAQDLGDVVEGGPLAEHEGGGTVPEPVGSDDGQIRTLAGAVDDGRDAASIERGVGSAGSQVRVPAIWITRSGVTGSLIPG